MAGSRMDTGFQAFWKRLEIGIMFGWPIQQSDGGDFGMRTRSRGFVRSLPCAACSVIRKRASSPSNGAQKNVLRLLRSSAPGLVRPTHAARSRSVVWRRAHLGGDRGASCAVQALRAREARATRLPGGQPVLYQALCLLHGVSKLRNRVIGRVFHALGLIEQWGSGIQRMTAACLDAGLAAPVFEEIATRFRVTMATAHIGRPALDETDKAILARLAGGKGLLTSEVAKAIDLTPRATRTRLARLAGRGLVHDIGTGPQDPKRRYFRVD